MLKKSIQNNWKTDIVGYAQSIVELEDTKYPAWTVKFIDSYGVAIPYEGGEEINETFANAKIRSADIRFKNENIQRAIVLTTDSDEIKVPFSNLCEALIDPGEKGEYRVIIESSPILWWKDWKELLGNKNIDERIYDVLGELCVLKYVVLNGEDAEWNGPDGASYDIETNERFVEVKSSISREKKEVTISNQFQLFPAEKTLDLVLCRFEPVIISGISIDSVMLEFENMGYNTELLNRKLELRGFERGMSARKKNFLLHEMLLYTVNDSFPRITPESFTRGVIPAGITKITYTVDLSGMNSISLLNGEDDDIQNN
ncbi:MAG: PD-(D/E)XK motif protein [Lachnospiraceae bacterium]|nr:PD-(D/E)XK motif protein [Lachnospiraceae bacterium]